MFSLSGSSLPLISRSLFEPVPRCSNASLTSSSPFPTAMMAYNLVDPVSNKTLIALIALITHYIVHRGEWDNAFHIVIGIWVILFGSVACFEYIAATSTRNVSIAIQLAARTASLYFAILVASILLHRGLYHRLRKVSI